MQLTWLGTAGFKVDTNEGATFLIDPFLSRPEGAIPSLPIQLSDLIHIDEIFLTNGRFDHAIDTPALVEQTGAIVHATLPVYQRLAAIGITPHCLERITLGKVKRVGSLTWQALAGQVSPLTSSPPLPALVRSKTVRSQISSLDRQWPLGEMVTYLFQADGLSIVHFGSAGWVDSAIHHLKPDIVLLPVESTPSINTNAVRLAAFLKPKVVIPHHWDNYYPPLSELIDLTKFEAVMRAQVPQTKVHKPTIGERFDAASLL